MFLTDSQTMNDLAIFSKGSSVFEIYCVTRTIGGAERLKEIFDFPLNDPAAIEQRIKLIQSFGNLGVDFPFDRSTLEIAESYLAERDERVSLAAGHKGLKEKLSNMVAGDHAFKNLQKGVVTLIGLLRSFQTFLQLPAVRSLEAFALQRANSEQLLTDILLEKPLQAQSGTTRKDGELAALDHILRFKSYALIKKLLRNIYEIDIYYSMAGLARENKWNFAKPQQDSGPNPYLSIKQVRHPLLQQTKGNDIEMDARQNLIFLTGANMAGKSTLMKSIGIAVYLAHLGLPVPVDMMEFTVMDGLLTTINLPDNLGIGASHFYAEVLRVKKVALELKAKKRLIVLFDELFRGTNVKDAAEATIAVLDGFSKVNSSLFIVSTHIMEAAESLKLRSDTIQYRFLPTKMQDNQPVYTYLLEKGVTEDRHGMVIIRNEGILQLLERGLKNRPL